MAQNAETARPSFGSIRSKALPVAATPKTDANQSTSDKHADTVRPNKIPGGKRDELHIASRYTTSPISAQSSLYTPKHDKSLWYFRDILGMEVAHTSGASVYLRGYGDYAASTLKLTEAKLPGVGCVAWRAVSARGDGTPGQGDRGGSGSASAGPTAISVAGAAIAFAIPTDTSWKSTSRSRNTKLRRICTRR